MCFSPVNAYFVSFCERDIYFKRQLSERVTSKSANIKILVGYYPYEYFQNYKVLDEAFVQMVHVMCIVCELSRW